MDAYISEAQIMSCDGVDELITELIKPGHKTICSARVNLELNNNGRYTRTIKAKLDMCLMKRTAIWAVPQHRVFGHRSAIYHTVFIRP
jgi:hypothetical protein